MRQSKVLYNAAFLLRPEKPVETKEELESLFDGARKALWPALVRIPPEFAFDDELSEAFERFKKEREWNVRFGAPDSLGFEIESSCARFGDNVLHSVRRDRGIQYPGLQGCSDRTEVVDIGFQTDWEGHCLRFSYNAEMRYSPFAGFGGEDPKELLQMPFEVAAVLQAEGLRCDLVLRNREPAPDDAPVYEERSKPRIVSDASGARKLAESIGDARRPVCLVLYFGATRKSLKEAGIVARKCALKAHVYVLRTTDEVLAPIRKALPGWNINRDVRERSCRVLFPFGDYASFDDANPRYRMAWPRRMSTRDRLTRIVKGLLRYFCQEDDAGLLGMRDMRRRLSGAEAKNDKELAEEAGRIAEAAESAAKKAESEAEDARRENRELRGKLADAEVLLVFADEDRGALEGTIDSLRKICEEQNARLAKAEGGKKPLPEMPAPPPVFKNLVEVLEYARKNLPNLEILKEAFPHARSLDHRNPTEGFQMLRDMNDILYPLFKEGGPNVATDFNSKSVFDCTFSEGGQTKGTRSIETERTIEVRGKKFVFWPHVRSRTHGEDRLIRAYFCYDPDAGKILVGFFGKHLRTAGTERMDT